MTKRLYKPLIVLLAVFVIGSGIFIPKTKADEPVFTFTSPGNSVSWQLGQTQTISWTKSPTAGLTFATLMVMRTDGIAAGTLATIPLEAEATTGSYQWSIPLEGNGSMMVVPNTTYFIRAYVGSSTFSASFDSSQFTIINNPNFIPDIAVTGIVIGSTTMSSFTETLPRQDWAEAARITFKNVGTKAASMLNSDLSFTVNGSSFGSGCASAIQSYYNNLAPNETGTVTCRFGGQLPLGQATLRAQISGIPFETNTSNNSFSRTYTVVAAGTTNLTLTNTKGVGTDLQALPGAQNVTLATFKIKAGDSEAVKVDRIRFYSDERPLKTLKNIKLVRLIQSWPATVTQPDWYGTYVSFNDMGVVLGAGQEANFVVTADIASDAVQMTSLYLDMWPQMGASRFIGMNSGQDVAAESERVKVTLTVASAPNSIPTPAPATTPTVNANNTNNNQNTSPANNPERRTFIEQEKNQANRLDKQLASRLSGKILLQVENGGAAWYVAPKDKQKYYLADGNTAFQALRKFGVGIKNSDLAKIPVGSAGQSNTVDSDGDGLSDKLEAALGTNSVASDSDGDGFSDGQEVFAGYNPLGKNRLPLDMRSANAQKGKILLQVEGKGEAWYVNPADGKRYYLADGAAAFQIMRSLSVGVNNDNLRKIGVGDM